MRITSNHHQKPPKPLSIMVHSMEGAGHINACIGLAQELHRRGHRLTFAVSADLKGRFIREGFGEILLHVKQVKQQPPAAAVSNGTNSPPPAPVENNPYKPFAEKVEKSGLMSGIEPLEKLKCHISAGNGFIEVIRGVMVDFDPQLEEAIRVLNPDVIILAHFLTPPAIARSNIPLVNIVPFNPVGLFSSPRIPPFFSGYSVYSDPASWVEFRQFQQNVYLPQRLANQALLDAACGYEPEARPLDPERSYFLRSDQLNIYGYPEELDYTDLAPPPPKTFRIDGFCRTETEQERATPLRLPLHFQPTVRGDRKLIYLSLGSMGAVNVPLMKRLLNILSTSTPHLYIVSKGPLADQYELPSPSCWGSSFLPQTKVLPLVDLVITHGGNNTITETFAMAKPMVVLPMFTDQYDNAIRVQDKGFGIRLDPFNFEDHELVRAVEQLLNDTELHQRLQRAAERIRTYRSKEKACEVIEAIVSK